MCGLDAARKNAIKKSRKKVVPLSGLLWSSHLKYYTIAIAAADTLRRRANDRHTDSTFLFLQKDVCGKYDILALQTFTNTKG